MRSVERPSSVFALMCISVFVRCFDERIRRFGGKVFVCSEVVVVSENGWSSIIRERGNVGMVCCRVGGLGPVLELKTTKIVGLHASELTLALAILFFLVL